MDEAVHRLLHVHEDLHGGGGGIGVERVEHALGAEELILGVGRLRHAVGVNEQARAGFQRQRVFAVLHALESADHEAVALLDELEALAGLPHGRELVPGVGRDDLAGLDVQHAEPDRDEHLLPVVGADLAVDRLEHLRGAAARHGVVLHKDLRDHHKERRGHALARHVGDDDAEVRLVDEEEVVEVAADLLGRVHRGVDVEFAAVGEGGEDIGQHICLDARGERELRADALLFGGDARDLLDVRPRALRERREGLCQDLDLIAGTVGLFHLKGGVAVAQGVDAFRHDLERANHAPGEDEGGRDGQQDDEHCQHDQGLHRTLRARAVACERLAADLVVALEHLDGRLVRRLQIDAGEHRPAHGGHGRGGHVHRSAVDLEELEPGRLRQRARDEGGERLILALAQVLCVAVGHAQRPLLLRGEEHAPAAVHDAQEAAVRGGARHVVADRVEINVGRDDGDQLPVAIDGRGALEHGHVGVGVDLDPGEDERPGFGGLPEPGPLRDLQREDGAVPVDVGAGAVVDEDHVPVRCADEDAGELVGGVEHGDHDLTHVRDQAQRLGVFGVGVRGVDEHGGRVPLVFRPGRVDGVGGKLVRALVKLRREGLQRRHVGADVVKEIVRDVGLQGGGAGHRRVDDGLHRLLRDGGDGRLLFDAGLLHDAAQALLVPDGDRGVDADEDEDEHQHKVEDLLLEPADFDAVYNFHVKDPFQSAVNYISLAYHYNRPRGEIQLRIREFLY